jgi:hypothetical protein
MLIDTNETFDDIIFSDESSIQLHQNKTVMYRLKRSLPAGLPKPKHPLKVHVWAAITRRGPSKITMFDSIMEKVFHQQHFERQPSSIHQRKISKRQRSKTSIKHGKTIYGRKWYQLVDIFGLQRVQTLTQSRWCGIR